MRFRRVRRQNPTRVNQIQARGNLVRSYLTIDAVAWNSEGT